MLVGLRIILIIAIMGGIIAYIGDKLGTRVGKRKLSLFGLRPKHTSIIVTIITGILISAATLGILSISSQHVRTALFGMEKLQAQMNQLNRDIDAKNKALEEGNRKLSERNKELQAIQEDVKATEAELGDARSSLAAMGSELMSIQDAYAEAEAKLVASNKEVSSLETAKSKLQQHVTNLQVTMKELEEGISHVREGNVVFRNGEVLSGAFIRPGLSVDESRIALAGFLRDTNKLVRDRFHMDDNQNVVYVSRQNIEEVAAQIAEATEPMTVRITAAANIIYGEPALAEIKAYPHTLVFKKGEVILTDTIMGGPAAQELVLGFLKQVNSQAKEHGVLPDPISGEVGSLPGKELFGTIRTVEDMKGQVYIEAVAKEDTFTSGPVHIRLYVRPLEER